MIDCIRLDQVDGVWPLFCDGFATAFARGGSNRNLADTLKALRCGAKFLHVIHHDGIAEVGIIADVTGDMLKVIAIAKASGVKGRGMRTWLRELRGYEWPKTVGARHLRFEGRHGWQRAVPGVRVVRQVYEMELA